MMPFQAIMCGTMDKSGEEKSRFLEPVREPCLVEMGTGKKAEHGLGAGQPIGRLSRVRPLERFLRQALPAKQGGTALILTPLRIQGRFFFFERVAAVGRCQGALSPNVDVGHHNRIPL